MTDALSYMAVRPGRSHSPQTVALARSLIVESHLTYRQAAARSGVCVATVGAWARRFGWRRAGVAPRPCEPHGRHAEEPAQRASRSTQDGGASFETQPSAAPRDDAVGSFPGRSVVPPKRRPRRYPPAMLEAARLRVEGSREGLERIAFDLGIERTSLYRWKRLHGWQRPSRPERRGPCFYRSARRIGRPYGADAVGTVRDLLA